MAQKCVATWQSLGIKAHSINVHDMMHGDLGVLRAGDYIVFVTNSGNTDELIRASTYLKRNFSDVVQVCISVNAECELAKWTHHSFGVAAKSPVQELVPTMSTVILMIVIDQIGFRLSTSTPELFKLCHPAGELGKK